MRLEAWLSAKNMSETEFARVIGVETSTITRMIPGEGKKQLRRPGWQLMLAIKDATNGAVTADDWLDAFAESPECIDAGQSAGNQRPAA